MASRVLADSPYLPREMDKMLLGSAGRW